MVNKRNIVIKVKYPVPGKSIRASQPKVITEWNVKRISAAAGILFLILLSLFYSFYHMAIIGETDVEQVAVEKANETVEVRDFAIPKQVTVNQESLDKSGAVIPLTKRTNKPLPNSRNKISQSKKTFVKPSSGKLKPNIKSMNSKVAKLKHVEKLAKEKR